MKEQEENDNIWKNIQFPIVKNIAAKSVEDSIQGVTAEECAEAMKNMFARFEKKTGYKAVVNNEHNSPINVLLPKEEKKYQIRITDSKGCGCFLYFIATNENRNKEAEKTANEFLENNRAHDEFMRGTFFHESYKAFKTIKVVEYDNDKKCIKRGGVKFKLRLSYNDLYEVI